MGSDLGWLLIGVVLGMVIAAWREPPTTRFVILRPMEPESRGDALAVESKE